MDILKEFQVNEFLSLKFDEEDRKTIIFVNGKLFRQCKSILFNIPVDKAEEFNEVESIDDVLENVGWKDEYLGVEQKMVKYGLLPEDEFFGHCSNLQVFYESNYDTKLLHRTLAFPLLKELTNNGDPIAKKVFKEEIVKRIENGNITVFKYLFIEEYIDYLSIDELNATLNPETRILFYNNLLSLIIQLRKDAGVDDVREEFLLEFLKHMNVNEIESFIKDTRLIEDICLYSESDYLGYEEDLLDFLYNTVKSAFKAKFFEIFTKPDIEAVAGILSYRFYKFFQSNFFRPFLDLDWEKIIRNTECNFFETLMRAIEFISNKKDEFGWTLSWDQSNYSTLSEFLSKKLGLLFPNLKSSIINNIRYSFKQNNVKAIMLIGKCLGNIF